jgi:hypothetical protein
MNDDAKPDPATIASREEADALVVRALSISIAAEDRDYTAAELDDLIYCLMTATVQLKKLPGGLAAAARVRDRANDELARRRRAKGPTTDVPNVIIPIDGSAVINHLPLELGGMVAVRLGGSPGASPLWACAATGKLLRSDACPKHPDAPCVLVGYEIVEGT